MNEAHWFQISITADTHTAARQVADSKAEEYFGEHRFRLLWTKATRATNAANQVPLAGFTVVFRYRLDPQD